jgi:hypothetical protein
MIARAARTARAEHRSGASWARDPLYPRPEERTLVTGRIRLTDNRPAADFRVILSTQTSTVVFPIAEPTYFVKTDRDGRFRLPGVPPAWQPGSTNAGSYTLYIQPADGSVTDLYLGTGSAAHDVRLTSVTDRVKRPVQVVGPDPNRFPVPIAAVLGPGASTVTEVTVSGGQPLLVSISADGGRAAATAQSSRWK